MTRTYAFMQVDAFTTTPLMGNPYAVLPDAEVLSEPEMQAIAREMNLSETAFILPEQDTYFRRRYFMPMEEVPLAGHPTIASVYALRELGRIPAEQNVVRMRLSSGIVTVEIRAAP